MNSVKRSALHLSVMGSMLLSGAQWATAQSDNPAIATLSAPQKATTQLLATQPKIGACPTLPADNIWNKPINTLPVHRLSAQYVSSIGTTRALHADFGPSPYGIPFITVPGRTQPKATVNFDYASESDRGPYPLPDNAPIEGASDRHVIAVDTDNCILYEMWQSQRLSHLNWYAGSGAVFHLTSDALRPAGWTSADAAGLPVLPGLVRYDEVASGVINHAIRVTAPRTQKAYVWPARHYASSYTTTSYPPMGTRFRLKANFDISSFPPQDRVILTALKKYGMILADNGSSWFISGATDSRWNLTTLHVLGKVLGSNFEAVDESSLQVAPNSGQSK